MREGDQEALDRLCRRYLPALTRWAHNRLPVWARDLLDTEDLVQETVMRTIGRVQEFQPRREGALQAYMRQAVMNRIQNEMRRARRHPHADPISDKEVDPGPSPIEATVGREALQRYERALAALRDEDREAIVARVELGLDYEALAEALEKPTPDAARVAIGRALVRLAQEMGRART